MSAFMVEDKVINTVVSWLSVKKYDNRDFVGLARKLETEKDEKEFAESMFQLNIKAIEQRYGEGQAKEFRPLDFEYKFNLPVSDIITLKALKCLLYQCSEGDVPETQLFKDLESLEYDIMNIIIRAIPEYDQAPWG